MQSLTLVPGVQIEPVKLVRPTSYTPYTLNEARCDARAAGVGLPTGFAELDKLELRFCPGGVYVVAGRPSEGKTTFMLNLLMRHVEERWRRRAEAQLELEGIEALPRPEHSEDRELDAVWGSIRGPAIYISYEDTRHSTYSRLLARQIMRSRHCAGAPLQVPPMREIKRFLRVGSVSPSADAAAWQADLVRAASELDRFSRAGLLVLLDGDTMAGNIDILTNDLTSAMRIAGEPAALVVVDYFQKVRPPEDLRGQSRQVQLQEVADLLRRLAKGNTDGEDHPERSVPVIVGAQVNRDAVKGQPGLEHIREADDLAQDASGVMTVYSNQSANARTVSIALVKNRDGQRGRQFDLGFQGDGRYVHALGQTPRSCSRAKFEGVI